MKTVIHTFLRSVAFRSISSVILIIYNFYEIYEDILEVSHEHIIIILGIVVFINCFLEIFEGFETLSGTLKLKGLKKRIYLIKTFLNNPLYHLTVGVVILIVSIHHLIVDIEQIASKSISFFIGLLYFISCFSEGIHAYKSILKAKKGIQN